MCSCIGAWLNPVFLDTYGRLWTVKYFECQLKLSNFMRRREIYLFLCKKGRVLMTWAALWSYTYDFFLLAYEVTSQRAIVVIYKFDADTNRGEELKLRARFLAGLEAGGWSVWHGTYFRWKCEYPFFYNLGNLGNLGQSVSFCLLWVDKFVHVGLWDKGMDFVALSDILVCSLKLTFCPLFRALAAVLTLCNQGLVK